ncbi:XTP/dITP diphosphatase [Acidaminobacter sp. JC074]|uniref:XTP/dITP diphosphatase n=1 Tax=Acidaminobacter sp. JC074 TaxID=2530199 RepID=UPI001F10FA89|nr:XTP/dITP diphosphatase [Acidaminobacter sp. JC074]
MKAILASNNAHKLEEIHAILKDFDIELMSMKEAGLDIEIEENGTTFEENSLIKAKAVVDELGTIAIADDSGLMVNALDGQPGVYSARYAGEPSNDQNNNEKLLKELASKDDRSAKFVSVITMLFPDGKTLVARGEAHGEIGFEYKGDNGFGYDPLFIDEVSGNTFAELSSEEKNERSHRAKALEILKEKLKELM